MKVNWVWATIHHLNFIFKKKKPAAHMSALKTHWGKAATADLNGIGRDMKRIELDKMNS